MDLLDNIKPYIKMCNKREEQDGLAYYASFDEAGWTTWTQAKFSDDFMLECSVSGQSSSVAWNLDELSC